MSKKTLNSQYTRNCPKCNITLYYNNTSALNLANRETKLCRMCSKLGKKTKKEHPDIVSKKCEKCNTDFEVIWKYRKQRFCSTVCMQQWRTDIAWVSANCISCGTTFSKRKKEKKKFCSISCAVTSEQKKEKLRNWANSSDNHWKDPIIQKKVRITKLEKYGDENYNNMEQNKKTMLERHGVPCAFHLPHAKSNGKRISKAQRQLYNVIVKTHPDAKLEYYLSDVDRSVDIYIPSTNKIIEFFGDYWHCNPSKYLSEYYHTQKHKYANEIWVDDSNRVKLFKSFGYDVEIIWECDWNGMD